MLIHKAAAWALVLTNLSLPVTLQAPHRLGAPPKTSTALAQTTPAETDQPPTAANSQDPDDPPSAPPNISIEGLLAIAEPSAALPVMGKSRADAEQERLAAEKLRIEAEEQQKIVERARIEAEIKAQKEAERMKHLASQEKLAESQRVQNQPDSVRVIGESSEQCVIYIQRVTNSRRVSGYAGNVPSQGDEPRVGAIALEKDYGHVSLVVAMDGDYLIVHDTNWVKGAITERRVHKSTQRGYVY